MSTPEPPLPHERLSPRVRALWRLRLVGATGLAVLVGATAGAPLEGALGLLAWSAPLLAGVLAVAVLPAVRYRRWRFSVDEEEIDLRHGGVTLRRTLVPMRRVQHVDSSSGALERLLALATVTVHTAGGSVSIPGLDASRAQDVHQRIAALARLTEDD